MSQLMICPAGELLDSLQCRRSKVRFPSRAASRPRCFTRSCIWFVSVRDLASGKDSGTPKTLVVTRPRIRRTRCPFRDQDLAGRIVHVS